MSYRTLVGLNHDYCPTDEKLLEWAKAMVLYMRSGDQTALPSGVTWKDMRHHSDPELLVKRANGVKNGRYEVWQGGTQVLRRLTKREAENKVENESHIGNVMEVRRAVPRRTSGN